MALSTWAAGLGEDAGWVLELGLVPDRELVMGLVGLEREQEIVAGGRVLPSLM
jgi:hypothetical protein